jgi:hypothetical protein
MLEYLLWSEVALKVGSGLILGLFPVQSPRAFGLPPTAGPFWTRLLAAVLVGIGLASLLHVLSLHGTITKGSGLGLGGSMALNLTAAAVLTGQLVTRKAATTRRGKATLWVLVIVLTTISLVELAYIAPA